MVKPPGRWQPRFGVTDGNTGRSHWPWAPQYFLAGEKHGEITGNPHRLVPRERCAIEVRYTTGIAGGNVKFRRTARCREMLPRHAMDGLEGVLLNLLNTLSKITQCIE